MKILAYSYRSLLSRGNTDLKYISNLTEMSSRIGHQIVCPDDIFNDVICNYDDVREKVSRRVLKRSKKSTDLISGFHEWRIGRLQRKLRWNLFYTNGRLPSQPSLGPTIKFDYIHEPNRYSQPAAFEDDVRHKRDSARLCEAIQVSTKAQKELFCEIGVPENKVFVVPFFLPQLENQSSINILEKHDDKSELRLLFVGHEEYRKGLDVVLEALLSATLISVPWRLTVVSKLSNRRVRVPMHSKISYIRVASREAMVGILRDSHLLLMPSRRETFGLVYLEAMAEGVVPIMADGPQQMEISDSGRCGELVGPCPRKTAAAIQALWHNVSRRKEMARAGLGRVARVYAPSVVASKYKSMYETVLG